MSKIQISDVSKIQISEKGARKQQHDRLGNVDYDRHGHRFEACVHPERCYVTEQLQWLLKPGY